MISFSCTRDTGDECSNHMIDTKKSLLTKICVMIECKNGILINVCDGIVNITIIIVSIVHYGIMTFLDEVTGLDSSSDMPAVCNKSSIALPEL